MKDRADEQIIIKKALNEDIRSKSKSTAINKRPEA